jgi:hypothetical protein
MSVVRVPDMATKLKGRAKDLKGAGPVGQSSRDHPKGEAQIDICRAISDRKIRVRFQITPSPYSIPTAFPDQATEPNVSLCRRVNDKLKGSGCRQFRTVRSCEPPVAANSATTALRYLPYLRNAESTFRP